ncbi:MAG: CpXC domain-containing protein [Chitinophagaceae bacterium]|nr:CpXC domain-containing protein [Anaerolineae bacterium]
MAPTSQTTIRCSACGQPFGATLRTYLDASEDQQSKLLLLTARLNTAQCPNCGTLNTIAVPLLYHDPPKELLVAYVPMELNLSKDQQEKMIGDLMRELPKTNFKGYMFAPKRALTMQGLIDLVLQSDGVTPEMMAQQRERVRLAQELAEAPEADLPALVKKYDTDIDERFFQTLTMMAQRALEGGRPDIAQQIIVTQSQIAELSTYGQELLRLQEAQEVILEEVADAIQGLGTQAQRADFLTLARKYADNDDYLQALVGLARPAFDYTFLEEMSIAISQAPTAEREGLNALRDRILDLTQAIDQQNQAAVQNAARFLQALMNEPNLDEAIHANLGVIDDTFMAVLTTNIQEAEKHQDAASANRLKQIYNQIIAIMQENMQPELLFVNQLLSAATDNEANALIAAQARDYGPELLEVMDAVGEVLAGQGNAAMQNRLATFREATARVLN